MQRRVANLVATALEMGRQRRTTSAVTSLNAASDGPSDRDGMEGVRGSNPLSSTLLNSAIRLLLMRQGAFCVFGPFTRTA